MNVITETEEIRPRQQARSVLIEWDLQKTWKSVWWDSPLDLWLAVGVARKIDLARYIQVARSWMKF